MPYDKKRALVPPAHSHQQRRKTSATGTSQAAGAATPVLSCACRNAHTGYPFSVGSFVAQYRTGTDSTHKPTCRYDSRTL
mmetsp:Transcript_76498/g.115128  ORF Transcript_76498/g.115128 Transcript_76498/m.115128 type:complete len:80 (-) Transcript_76498:133-372(-)